MSDKLLLKKKALRKKVADLKSTFTEKELLNLSEEVISTLNLVDVFQNAKIVLAYYSMPDEVDTHRLIKTHHSQKQFLLPVVNNDELILKKYISEESMLTSDYGIKEPTSDTFLEYDQIDLVIVPGVAFDRTLNRMGRGKGFYDRLLPKIKAPKIGVCFDFQLFDEIPTYQGDIKMNMIVSQNEVIVE